MTKRRKILIAVSVIVVVLVIACVAVYFIFFNKSGSGMQVRSIHGADYQVSQFHKSSMNLNNNGTFSVVITQDEDTRWFVGIGTYTKSGGKVKFNYFDAWIRDGNDFLRDNTAVYIGQTHEYPISKRDQVEFVYNNITFYFK